MIQGLDPYLIHVIMQYLIQGHLVKVDDAGRILAWPLALYMYYAILVAQIEIWHRMVAYDERRYKSNGILFE